MNPESTSVAPGVFATTHWSVVVGTQERDSDVAHSALGNLCETYWRPVYAFVRRTTPDEHSAKDLTQGFFESFLGNENYRSADQQRGRFRNFLLTCVKNYLSNERNKQNTQRRGGGTTTLSIERLIEDGAPGLESNSSLSPDRNYERQWAHSVLKNARVKLQDEFKDSGKTEIYDVLHVYLAGRHEGIPYQAAAEQLEISVDAVKKSVERMRRRFGQLLREEIAQTVLDPSEIKDELQFLKSALQN